MVNHQALHILTYDVRGTLPDGTTKPTRQTGLVTHTHQLLAGLAHSAPLALTHTGQATEPYPLHTPEGHAATAQGIGTHFPQLTNRDGSKIPERVTEYYETRINQADNPVYTSLAAQYAQAIRRADTRNVLAQNTNPVVAILKAEEHGLLPHGCCHLTGVIHDTDDMHHRFNYIRQRLAATRMSVHLVAVSHAVRNHLVDTAGIPAEAVTTIPNGIDDDAFRQAIHQARKHRAYARLAHREKLPTTGRMVLTSARRVRWKGHLDALDALTRLPEDVHLVINGAGLTDTRDPGYETELTQRARTLGIHHRVHLPGPLSDDGLELAALYDHAHACAHPSRNPEPFGYANVEAMLAATPVITTAHGGPLEYITHGTSGVLVPPEHPDQLATALRTVLNNPTYAKRLAEGGEHAARRYGLHTMATRYRAVIDGHTCPNC